jgi:hypothetical protein
MVRCLEGKASMCGNDLIIGAQVLNKSFEDVPAGKAAVEASREDTER